MITEYLLLIILLASGIGFLGGALVACCWTHWKYRTGISLQNNMYRRT